jgi:uncharacterized protein (DUF58 family)
MIVPRTRMLLWVAVMLPVAAAGGLFAPAGPPAAAAFAILVLVALVDALAGIQRLDGLEAALSPDVVRLSKDHPGELGITVTNVSEKPRLLRIGLPFPSHVEAVHATLRLALPAGSRSSRASWEVTGRKRGCHPLHECYLEVASPLGFWDARKKQDLTAEIRIYPSLIEERKKVAALFLNRSAFGVHSRRMVGQGRDFEKLREYVPGDSYDVIHWKATARRGRPITKVYQIERTQEVYVLIDFSRLTSREVMGQPLLEHFLQSGLILGTVAQRQGDLFGVVCFGDRVRTFVRAGNGKAHYNACRDALYQMETRIVSPDFDELFSFVRVRLRRRALLLCLTDLSDPILAEGFVRSVELVARQHLVIVNMVRPAGAYPLFSTGPVNEVDEVYDRLTGHLLWRNLRELQNVLQRRGIRLVQLGHTGMTAQIVGQYMSIKQRQVL